MDTITRKLPTGERSFRVLTQAEADAEGIGYVSWREVEPGGWALTDDGYVTECVDVKRYVRKGRPRNLVKLSFAMRWNGPGVKFEWTPHRDSGYIGSILTPRSWIETEVRRGRTKRMIKAYAAMLLNRNVDFDKLGAMYRKDQKIPRATVKRILKQEVVKQMVSEELETQMKEAGLSVKYVLDLYKTAAEQAKTDMDAEAMLKAANSLAELLDMKPKKVQRTLTASETFTRHNLEGDIERESKSLSLSEVRPAEPLAVAGVRSADEAAARESDQPDATPPAGDSVPLHGGGEAVPDASNV